jgi:hypothetical protein
VGVETTPKERLVFEDERLRPTMSSARPPTMTRATMRAGTALLGRAASPKVVCGSLSGRGGGGGGGRKSAGTTTTELQ